MTTKFESGSGYLRLDENDPYRGELHEEIVADINNLANNIENVETGDSDYDQLEEIAQQLDGIIGIGEYGLGEIRKQSQAIFTFYSSIMESDSYEVQEENFVDEDWEKGIFDRLREAEGNKREIYDSWRKEHIVSNIWRTIEQEGAVGFIENNVEVNK